MNKEIKELEKKMKNLKELSKYQIKGLSELSEINVDILKLEKQILEKKLEITNLVAEYGIKYGHNFFGDSAIKYHKKGNMSSEEFIKIYEYYFENGGHSCDKEKLDAYYKELKENNKMANE